MFTDYAVCVFISLGITALAMAVYGIGHLLKRTATALVKFLQFKDLPVEIAVERNQHCRHRYWRRDTVEHDRGQRALMRERAAASLAMLFFILPTIVHAQQHATPQPAQVPFTINVSVDEVLLHATVENRRGAPVSGLRENDFHVFEDGAPQPIRHFGHSDIPVTVGLVIDNSGSMGPKRRDVIAAALVFARSSNPQDQMFVVNFNEKVSFGLADDIPFTDEVPQLEKALSRIAASGETALYDAIAAGLDHLKQGNRDKKVLIIVSDGGDNASRRTLPEIMALAGRSDAIIYTIGIFDENDHDRNPSVLKKIARTTGGEVFLPESLQDVAPICERIAHDIRDQYTIAYVPTNRKRDGTYRAIAVKAGDGLVVRTRAGYFAPATDGATASGDGHEGHN